MSAIYASVVLDHDIDDVWAVVRDFHGLDRWQPAVASTARAYTSAGARPVRVLTMADGATVIESLAELDELDENERALTYEIVESPYPVDFYRGRIELRPVTDSGATFVGWSITFDAHPGEAGDLAGALRNGIVQRGLRGLADHLATRA